MGRNLIMSTTLCKQNYVKLKKFVEFAFHFRHFFHDWVFDAVAFFHNHGKCAQGGEALKRVFFADNEVGGFAFLNRAGAVADAG